MDCLVSFLLGFVFIAICVVWIIAIIASYQVQNYYLDVKEIVVDEETAKEYEPLLAEALKNKHSTPIHPCTEIPLIKVRISE